MEIPTRASTGSTMEIVNFSEDSLTDRSLDDSNIDIINVHGAYKRYGNQIVLNNFNMSVPEGCIFGLLGASGCGKTTLLNCIVGINEIDIGEIHVKYKKLSEVGLMPQDTALIPALTITETFNYFGKIFGMSSNEISSRAKEISELLDLPLSYRRTSELSGGQQRRVSLAVALLHDPKLLLLDEPTVGLDPVLSKNIWNHLKSITVKHKKTVVITTHYIEEARQANLVGLMRQGRLVETGSPTQLIEKYNCSSLEETFLFLSQKDDGNVKYDWPATPVKPPVQATFNRDEKFSKSRFQAQFYKNTLFIIRQTLFMSLLVLLPLLQSNILHWALGRDPASLSIAVVNDEAYNCTAYTCNEVCSLEGLSCCYLEDLRKNVKTFHLVYKNNLREAKQMVVKNQAWALIYFPRNFSSVIELRAESFFSVGKSNETIDSGQVHIFLDSTDKIIEMFLKRKFTNTFFDFLGKRYSDCEWNPRAAQLPFKIEDPIYGSKEPIFTHYQTAPIIMNCCFFLPMMLTPMFLLDEKLSGFLQRSISSGLTIVELLVALFGIQLIVLVLQTAVFFIFLFVIYGHPFVTQVWLPFTICIYEGISGICFGILMSFISNSYIMASLGGNGMFFMMNFTNGFIWPLQAVHPSIKIFFWASPLALATEALRSMTVRGWTFLHPEVYNGFISITVWTLLYLILIKMVGLKNGMIVKK